MPLPSSFQSSVGHRSLIVPSIGIMWLLAMLVAVGPFSIDAYLPAMPIMAEDLQTNPNHIQWTLSIFLLGFSMGMMISGPIADQHGRRRTLLCSIGVYAAASLGCAFATDIEMLIAMRLLQALGGGSMVVLSRAIVRDIYGTQGAAKALSQIATIAGIAPVIAPALGAQILHYGHWRLIFVGLLGFASVCWLCCFWKMPETLQKNQRVPGGIKNALAVYWMICKTPRALGYALCGSSVFAAMFAYLSGAPFVFIHYFGMEPRIFGWILSSTVIAHLAGNWLNSRLVNPVGLEKMINWGLAIAVLGGLITLWQAFAAEPSVGWILFGIVLIEGVVGTLGTNSIAKLIRMYPQYAGTVSAVFGAFMFALGSLASFITASFFEISVLTMCLVMSVCIAIGVGSKCLLTAQRFNNDNTTTP